MSLDRPGDSDPKPRLRGTLVTKKVAKDPGDSGGTPPVSPRLRGTLITGAKPPVPAAPGRLTGTLVTKRAAEKPPVEEESKPRLRGTLIDAARRKRQAADEVGRLMGPSGTPAPGATITSTVAASHEPPPEPGRERRYEAPEDPPLSREERRRLVVENARLLAEVYKPIAGAAGLPLAQALLEESSFTRRAGPRPRPDIAPEWRYTSPLASCPEGVVPIDTGRDLGWLAEHFGGARFRFALSFDELPERGALRQTFAEDLVARCRAEGLSLLLGAGLPRSESLLVDTWDFRAMAALLAELHARYAARGLFAEVRRFFEGALPFVSEDHVSVTQQPAPRGSGPRSPHRSTHRDLVIQAVIATERETHRQSFEDACRVAGLRPEGPWRLLP